MHLDHLTEHRVREAELVRRVEQARQDRERLAARTDVEAPEHGSRRRRPAPRTWLAARHRPA
ncbi:hypothetical protein [Isoptericola croceus]|uniref:hypothetical protein n=1 Tax=Isoptericola croceus TaxID=3031406 RepID=UPI0023F97422|nr:hypothetical protein [Isoptericola croceus]